MHKRISCCFNTFWVFLSLYDFIFSSVCIMLNLFSFFWHETKWVDFYLCCLVWFPFLSDVVLFESYHENLLKHAMVIKTFLHSISLPKIYGAYQNLCNYLNWQISNLHSWQAGAIYNWEEAMNSFYCNVSNCLLLL